jgi:Ca2+-dependent lipid-binding protein
MAASSTSPQRLKGILSVTIVRAKNLIKADWFSQNDTYAAISLHPFDKEKKKKSKEEKQQTETYQMTQVHPGSNPIFNEKFVFPVPQTLDAIYVELWDADLNADDLLGYGHLSLRREDQAGRFDTDLDKEWLHIVSIPLLTEKNKAGGDVEVILHFIPESVAAFVGKKFNAIQAEVKKKITQRVVARMTDVASDKIRGYVGITD